MKTRKPLSAKTPLRAKTSLKAKTGLKANLKPKKQPKAKLTALRRKADKLFAHAIRLRDSDFIDGAWQGKCITCPRICLVINAKGKWQKSNGWGHFVGRGNMFLRYDEENVNLQCSHCNAWRDKNSMIEAYRLSLDDKYGNGTWEKLTATGDANKNYRLTISHLQQIIHDAEEELKFYLGP